MSNFLDHYESLDVIGNGSFGIIRKVRRKADGQFFARKELNFDRMSERDRKQIVAEVNILKDLHHEHIVGYHDRYVDRDAGILYILMEYCGGGDLSAVIKQASRQNRPIPEDTIWNYFMQILLALQHCHHPNGYGKAGWEGDGKDKRAQILHRDLKPDNVFLDENGSVKLGDFGLSKALPQASFANTYVGTPYYMSPELMQEKAYDSKSDIWSLGCLIYELCALKPPFHEAKTHSELSIFIRNGRIPPLPRGYSQALSAVIKSMLSQNPAMRPSAAQLLQHERLELVFKVAEAEKMLSTVKSHRSTVASKEREVIAREQALLEKERHISNLLSQKDTLLSQKDSELNALQALVSQLQHKIQSVTQITPHEVEAAIKHAVLRREEELRVLVAKREEEVAAAMAKREEEIMEAVRRREAEMCELWVRREVEIRKEVEDSIKLVEERVGWIGGREEELKQWEEGLERERVEIEETKRRLEEEGTKGRVQKPLEEVKNVYPTNSSPVQLFRPKVQPSPKPAPHSFPPLETPITRPNYRDFMPSAMKGVVLTSTGETISTPSPAEVATLFNASPKVGLNFAKIFDFEEGEDDYDEGQKTFRVEVNVGLPIAPPSPSDRKEKERAKRSLKRARTVACDNMDGDMSDTASSSSNSTPSTAVQPPTANLPPTRLRKPSIRSLSRTKSAPLPASSTNDDSSTVPASSSSSDPTPKQTKASASSSKSTSSAKPRPLPHPHLHSTTGSGTTSRSVTFPGGSTKPVVYDFNDEENLPSPFLKKQDKGPMPPANYGGSNSGGVGAKPPTDSGQAAAKTKKRTSLSMGNTLRAIAAANNISKRATEAAPDGGDGSASQNRSVSKSARPALASARRATEEARKALSRS